MNDFFEYLNYRDLLKALCEEKKKQNSWFSYRWLSKKIELSSSGFLSLVLSGKRNISIDIASRICNVLKFSKRETDYFLSLVRYSQTANVEEKIRIYEDVLSLRPTSAKSLRADQQEFYNHWYYSAIRELISIINVSDDYRQISECLVPKINEKEAKDAVDLLKRLNLISKNAQGNYEKTDTLITSAGSSIDPSAIRKYQSETIELAKNALYKISKESRDISTVTLSTNDQGMEMIRKKIEQCRSEIMTIAAQSKDPDRIIQCNMQLFPLGNAGEATK